MASVVSEGMGHGTDAGMAAMTWEFLKDHQRPQAATALRPAPACLQKEHAEDEGEESSAASVSINVSSATQYLFACFAALIFICC